jgi:thermitase
MRRLFVVLLLFAFVAAFAASSRGEAKAKASAEYEPTTILVGFSDATSASARAAVHDRFGGVVVNRFPWINVDVVRIPTGASPPEVASSYETVAGVEYAHPNWTVQIERLDAPASIPNDTRFGEMWGMHNTGQSGGTADADIDAPEGWDLAFGPGNFPNSGGIRVGVLDTGITANHEDLLGKTKICAQAINGTGQITPGVCPDQFNHGTHVAGTIAANTNNALGVVGVAPNAEIAMFRAFNAGGSGQIADLIAGWHWLHTTGQAIVINHSWGGAPPGGALQAEATEAHNAGALSIASAGNCGCSQINYPAGFAEVISVPATTRFDTRASFSNFNADTEIAAPGQTILSTSATGGYVNFDGTSMASPHVTGAAALVRWKFGTNPNATRAILDAAVDDKGAPGRDTQFGFGRLNLAKALAGGGGDTGTIAGKVRRKGGGGGPIAGATVNCPGAGSDTTGADGSYSIADVDPGNYSCTASASGFRSKTKPVTVNAGQTSTLNFKLRRA